MRTLLKTCANLKRGHAELQAVKDDPDGLVELLERIRAEDGPDDLRSAAIMAMRRHGSSDSVMTALATTLREAPHWRERSLTTTALAHIGTSRAREILIIAMDDQDKRVRSNAKLNLKQLDRKRGNANANS